ncbi:DNA cytosine methyltransferase [Bacillus cereus]|uniref:DNA cytosine methyltransferase n=1 Tax=Bacillus cereus TaxID=1396 RepID=UPI000B4AE5D3|nr:DNA cytosine methyltransferase [Bacillus cereus]
MLIKKRKAKNSARGIYLQDNQLQETVFKPGSSYKYIIDQKNKQVSIVPTDGEGNKVSKRKIKSGEKPVIDIRDTAALKPFKGADYLEIEIFEDKVLVTGYEEDKKEEKNEEAQKEKASIFSKAKKVVSNLLNRKAKVIDFTKVLNAKKKFEFVLSKKQLDKVVGGSFVQTSIFDFLESNESHFGADYSSVKEALDNVKIPLKAISLFSGAGVLDQGFVEEGFEIALAIEKDPEACETYRYNFGDHIVNEDITKFDFSKFNEIGAPVMFGGSPCQGFSNSNRYTNFLDNPNNILVRYFIEAIKANKHCKFFVLENVPQILTAGDGKFRDEIISELSEFNITTGIINAADMGSAQHRKRAIFIGSKIEKLELPKPILQPEEYVTVGEAFEGLNDSIPNQLDYSKGKADTIERMKHVPQGGNWRDIPDELKTDGMLTGKTHSSVYKRLRWDEPAITITNVRKSNITHPTENRSLTIRECARLFGLPDTFVFKGSKSSMQQQICNAVTVHYARSAAKVLKIAIQLYNIRNGFESLQLVK